MCLRAVGKANEQHTKLSFYQFPKCTEEDAISVACLELHYCVNVDENHKDREETHQKRALKDLQDDVELRGKLDIMVRAKITIFLIAQPNENEHLGKVMQTLFLEFNYYTLTIIEVSSRDRCWQKDKENIEWNFGIL